MKKHGRKTDLLLSDTDILMYEVEIETVHEDFYKDKELFEFDNYLKESKYYDGNNNFVVGKVKDETCSVLIKSFVRLKTYILAM